VENQWFKKRAGRGYFLWLFTALLPCSVWIRPFFIRLNFFSFCSALKAAIIFFPPLFPKNPNHDPLPCDFVLWGYQGSMVGPVKRGGKHENDNNI